MNAADHIKRLDDLKALRRPLESFWKFAYDYTYPLRGERFGQDGTPAESVRASSASKQAAIYDGTLRRAVRLLASALLSGMTPANSLWVALDVYNIRDDEGKRWLGSAAEAVWKNIHASNYDLTAFEAFIDFVISGMFALYIDEGNDRVGPISFQQWPLYSVYCADSTGKGLVDTVYRSLSLTAEQAVSEYGNEVSETIKKTAEKKPDERFEFVQCIYPRGENSPLELPIVSEHIEVKGKRTVRESGYHEMPVIAPRWLIIPDSVYSVGAVDDALADAKTLNKLVEMILSNADLAISGMWGAVDDGVLNPKAVTVGPRKIIPVANKDSFFPLKSGTNFDVGALEKTELQRAIKETLMSDQLQPQDGPAMTATEVHIRTQLIRQLLGPMYGRLQSEFLQPLVERCFGLLFRAGAFKPMPESLAKGGGTIHVRYNSPLAKAQKIEDVGAMERFEGGLFAMAKGAPTVLDVYDLDEAARKKAELLGVTPDLIRDADKLKAFREARTAAMEKQRQSEQAHELKKTIAPKMADQMGMGA